MNSNRSNTIVMWGTLGIAVLALVIAVYAVGNLNGAGLTGTAGLPSARDAGTTVTGPFVLNCTKPTNLNASFQYADGFGGTAEMKEPAKAGTRDMFTGTYDSKTLTLKRTLGSDKSLSDWYLRHAFMQNCDFSLMDLSANASTPTVASQWALERIAPVEYSIETVDKDGNLLDKPREVLKIDYDTFTRTK